MPTVFEVGPDIRGDRAVVAGMYEFRRSGLEFLINRTKCEMKI